MAHKEKRRKKTLPLLLAALTLAGAGLWWGNYTLSVEEYAFSSSRLPPGWDGGRLVVLSDLHGRQFGRDNSRLAAAVEAAHPDVIALVGERGREVLEFMEKDLGPEGMRRSILVVATSDQPAMLRKQCPSVATGIAEFFRDQGYDVLLMMDSLTRFAMAQREIGLAVGEPPVSRGYTPSIYAELPKLLERSGNFQKGSITGVYTVLVEGDDTNEPIADTVRGILDGHIVLSRRLANSNHFPAIDIGASISRLMADIVSDEHKRLAARVRDVMGIYEKNADLVSVGAYKAGTNPRLDYALGKMDGINQFLTQGVDEAFSYEEDLEAMRGLL